MQSDLERQYLFITFLGKDRSQETVAFPRERLQSIVVDKDNDSAIYYQTSPKGKSFKGPFEALKTKLIVRATDSSLADRVVLDEGELEEYK